MLARAPWQWMIWKPPSLIKPSSVFSTTSRFRPANTVVGMPISRASWAKGPSIKHTMWMSTRVAMLDNRDKIWVLAPPVSPPLIRCTTFIPDTSRCKP